MTKDDVLTLLEKNKNERGILNWNKMDGKRNKLKTFGLGLTQLRKLAKKIGRDHDLAMELWLSDYYDAKVIALLIDDPKQISKEQAEKQVEELEGGYLAHVFSSCDATLAKTSFTKEIADKWILSDDPVRRSCGYGLLYEISKWKNKKAPDNDYFIAQVKHMEHSYKNESIPVQMALASALMGIGKRNLELNDAALRVAQLMGPIDFDPTGKCDPFDVSKHLVKAREKQQAVS